MNVNVILPTLNEEKGVGKTIDSIKTDSFKKNNWNLEIIIVDGESKDKTREIAKSKGAKIIIEKRKGYGRAYKTGISKATGDIIVTGDADATYPFDRIHLILALALKVLFLINLRDSQSGMWIFRKEALKKIQPLEDFNDGMPFSEEIKIEMFSNKNIKTKEIPSALYAREGDVKLQSFTDGIKNFKYLFKKRVN
ncbi:MAG: glycosyl transferase family 2 [Thermoplasmatales archaeon SG8-52-3]|nr:MAG: glycosyl transferase family 2 [Thermoplasmatales archaeon SG8-52-3]